MQIDVLKQKFPPKDKNNLWLDDNSVLRQFKNGSWVPFSGDGNVDLSEYYTKSEVNNHFYQKSSENETLEQVIEDIINNVSSSYDGGDVTF